MRGNAMLLRREWHVKQATIVAAAAAAAWMGSSSSSSGSWTDCQRVVEKKMGLLLLPSNLKSETKK